MNSEWTYEQYADMKARALRDGDVELWRRLNAAQKVAEMNRADDRRRGALGLGPGL